MSVDFVRAGNGNLIAAASIVLIEKRRTGLGDPYIKIYMRDADNIEVRYDSDRERDEAFESLSGQLGAVG